MCGCGQKTNLARYNDHEKGYVLGQPMRYRLGHALARTPVMPLVAPNPSGYCECGCGASTPAAKRTNRQFGHLKGHPVRFIAGHQLRNLWEPSQNLTALCACGCGGRTRSVKWGNASKGLSRGQAQKFIRGHQQRKPVAIQEDEYLVADLGFDTPCWVYLGLLDPKGYGIRHRTGTGTARAHRQSYTEFVGPIPSGKSIHHRCRHPACINPTHLEAMPVSENTELTRGTRPPRAVRLRVFERDGHRCRRCGVTKELSIDHIVPLCRDGTHDEANLQTLCRSCNSKKGRYYFLDERLATATL